MFCSRGVVDISSACLLSCAMTSTSVSIPRLLPHVGTVVQGAAIVHTRKRVTKGKGATAVHTVPDKVFELLYCRHFCVSVCSSRLPVIQVSGAGGERGTGGWNVPKRCFLALQTLTKKAGGEQSPEAASLRLCSLMSLSRAQRDCGSLFVFACWLKRAGSVFSCGELARLGWWANSGGGGDDETVQ